MKHIVLYTATGCYNLGDEYILKTECQFLQEEFPNATLHIATYDRRSSILSSDVRNVKFFSYFPNGLRAHFFRNIGFFLKNIFEIARADLVVIGGGGLFYDNESGQSFLKQRREWWIRIFFAKLFRRKIVFWWIGIDVQEENKEKLRYFFSGKWVRVSVRDDASERMLESMKIHPLRVYDPAFLYPPKPRTHHRTTRPKVGIALRSGYIPNEEENISKMIIFLQAQGYEPIFLNHSFHKESSIVNDRESFAAIANVRGISSTETISETLALYSELDFVISMRLHASILACMAKIPFCALSYAKKTDEILSDIENPYILSARDFDIETFKKMFLKLAEERELAQFALGTKYDTIRENAYIQVKKLFYGF